MSTGTRKPWSTDVLTKMKMYQILLEQEYPHSSNLEKGKYQKYDCKAFYRFFMLIIFFSFRRIFRKIFTKRY